MNAYRLRDGVRATVESASGHGWRVVDSAAGRLVVCHTSLEIPDDTIPAPHCSRGFVASDVYLTIECPQDDRPLCVRMAGPAYSWEVPSAHRITVWRADRVLNDLGGPMPRMHPHRHYRSRRRTVFGQPAFWALVLGVCVAVALLAYWL